ncbi:hypothetical protein VHEMI04619 [[Torrubiella] hemipterigena]|uniref:N-acetyltransferase domain-containing protein n=1 Tax=[Torrubiella] hemipterigena TaxID=1531966 RepID=A0A0A1SVT4_9HYPO|nr:hypothetical protein VHEMI04619 [[Torrubiella] hemipterigena]
MSVIETLGNAFETERLIFAPIDPKSEVYMVTLDDMFAEPALQALTYNMLLRPQSPRDIDFLVEQFDKALLGVAICLKPTGDRPRRTVIGTLWIGWGGLAGCYQQNRNADIGLILAKRHRGMGYGREALTWGVDWAFRHANLHMLHHSVFEFNTTAIEMCKSLGFEQTGKLKEAFWMDRKYHDEFIFCMTEDDWEKHRQKQTDDKHSDI